MLRAQVLDRLVVEEIQAQRADHAGINVPDEQVNAALTDIAKRQKLISSSCPISLPAGHRVCRLPQRAAARDPREMLRQRDVVQRITISPHELEEYLELTRRRRDRR